MANLEINKCATTKHLKHNKLEVSWTATLAIKRRGVNNRNEQKISTSVNFYKTNRR